MIYGIGLAVMVLGLAWAAGRIPEDLSSELDPEERKEYRKYKKRRQDSPSDADKQRGNCMQLSDIQHEVETLKNQLSVAGESEKVNIQSRLYELEQRRKAYLAEEARRRYAEAGWIL